MKKLLYILLFVPLALFGQENYSMNFDGSNNFIEINHHPSLVLSNLSISFWMKTSNTNSGIKSLIAKENFNNDDVNGEWWVYMNHASQNKVNFYVIENNTYGGVTHSSFLNDNIWHFVSITRNGDTGEQIITVDGQNPIFSSGPSGILSEPVSLFIGGGNNYNYNGLIDNVAIWNTILTPEESALHMHCPLTGQEEGLVGYWNFNEGSGNTAYDVSVNGNHGVINGATFSSDIPSQNCLEGCIDSLAYNYNQLAGISDNSCIYSGCINPDAINFDETATIDDEESCIYSHDYVHGLWNEVDDGAIEFNDYQEQATTSLSSLQQALDTWNTTIDLDAGWNMFGYGCPNPIDIAEGLSNHTESIIITKDNNGNVYMPEFGFNGIGDLTPGYGYQIKLTEAIEGFSLCDWYVNDIPEDNIVSLQEEISILQDSIEILNTYEIGDYTEGGIVFYVDETGQRGLTASTESFLGYPFGCDTTTTDALNSFLGSGLQNTLSILEQSCTSTNGDTTAAAAAYYYNDEPGQWWLPSIDELALMYQNIGPTTQFDFQFTDNNITDTHFQYWSSTDLNEESIIYDGYYEALALQFIDGEIITNSKIDQMYVRPVKAFGNWTMGCMDSLACNYNLEANMADGSCTYVEQGFDCNGYVIAEIGDEFQGGILFYISETGKHGLVAAIQDIAKTNWENAIEMCDLHEASGLSDWYLPSKEDLLLMYFAIGHGSPLESDFNFADSSIFYGTPYDYWSSNFASCENNKAEFVGFSINNGGSACDYRSNDFYVRPIRSF